MPQVTLFLHLNSMGVDRAGNAGTENHASFERVDLGLEHAPGSPGIVHGELAPRLSAIDSK